MKKLEVNTAQYHYLEHGFKEWLDILGYNPHTVYNMPNIIREFFYYLESRKIRQIQLMKQQHVKDYYSHICKRANERRGGGLSEKYILMHMQTIEKLLEYLHYRKITTISSTGVRLTTPQRNDIIVLTTQEVQQLFTVTLKETASPLHEAINARDRAMLVIYYSCGLRRNEGIHVNTDDVNFDRRILHVRKGKNYKERFVPFNKTNSQYLQQWIYDYRPQLLKGKKEHRLFINVNGNAMIGGTLYSRLKRLQTATEDISLHEKTIGLHTLRHSIATHLLQAGMSLERISQFLGHRSLDSTQIYTHLKEAPP